jgi:hypothetical protein
METNDTPFHYWTILIRQWMLQTMPANPLPVIISGWTERRRMEAPIRLSAMTKVPNASKNHRNV